LLWRFLGVENFAGIFDLNVPNARVTLIPIPLVHQLRICAVHQVRIRAIRYYMPTLGAVNAFPRVLTAFLVQFPSTEW
jgi:hypothetical protein